MYESKHPIINVTVDARLLVRKNNESCFVLIRRGGEPFKGKLAMPGGFVNSDETLAEAINRECREEIGVDPQIGEWDFLTVADTPDRDPRGRTISMVYTGSLSTADLDTLQAGDDAAAIAIIPCKDLKPEDCAFDHYELLKFH